jgi:outer membrane immunogenic protein
MTPCSGTHGIGGCRYDEWGVEDMRTLVLALTGLLAASICPAIASDLPPAKAPPVVVAPISWAGFYVGINAGAGMADAAMLDPDGFDSQNTKFQTAFGTGGGQIGYNWQWRAMVLGLEGDVNWASVNASDRLEGGPSQGSTRFKFNLFTSVRGRMGLAYDNALIYVTAGPVWGHFKSGTVSSRFSDASNDSGWHPGLAIGPGVEFILTSNWTLRGEYLFLHFRDIKQPVFDPGSIFFTCDTAPCRINYAYSAHVARLGLNYRFGY